MRFVPSLLIAAALSLPVAPALAEQAPYPDSEKAYDAEIAKFRWKKGPGSYDLGESHARVGLPQGIEILTGPDAERMAFLINGILISGARPFEDFAKWIDQEIAANAASAAPAPEEKPAS